MRLVSRILACAALLGAPLFSASALQQPASAPARVRESAAPREQTADEQVIHVLNRLAFGARPGEAERVRAIGVDAWIARQLEPKRIEDPAMERLLARFELLDESAASLARRFPAGAEVRRQLENRRRMNGDSLRTLSAADSARYREAARASQRPIAELGTARVARAVASERQLEEVMVDFWHNHFTVFAGKGQPMRYFLVEYDRDVIRPHAMGRFRDLLGAVAKSQAMLFYLDNWQSAADSGRPVLGRLAAGRGPGPGMRPGARAQRRPAMRPGSVMPPMGGVAPTDMMPPAARRRRGLNENYARELLELHTIGVDGGYTQQDVIAVARALTGWSLADARRGGGFVFRPEVHDAGEKIVLGTRLAPGRGIEDGEQVLDLLARHPNTARHVSTRLVRRLVSDSAPPELVARAAETFLRTDGDLREVVRTIVTSPEFFSRAAFRAKVKSPFELVVSTMRAVGSEPDTTPRTALLIGRLGQPLWGHQAPNGWPEESATWMSTGAILDRINFGMLVASGRAPGVRIDRWPAWSALRGATREAQVDGVIGALLHGRASTDTRAVLVSGTNPLLARAATEGPPLVDDPAMDGAMGEMGTGGQRGNGARRMRALDRPLPPLGGLAQIVGLALGSPEFQRK